MPMFPASIMMSGPGKVQPVAYQFATFIIDAPDEMAANDMLKQSGDYFLGQFPSFKIVEMGGGTSDICDVLNATLIPQDSMDEGHFYSVAVALKGPDPYEAEKTSLSFWSCLTLAKDKNHALEKIVGFVEFFQNQIPNSELFLSTVGDAILAAPREAGVPRG